MDFDQPIYQEKLEKIKKRIVNLEHKNAQSSMYKDSEIVERIIKLIQQEVENDN